MQPKKEEIDNNKASGVTNRIVEELLDILHKWGCQKRKNCFYDSVVVKKGTGCQNMIT